MRCVTPTSRYGRPRGLRAPSDPRRPGGRVALASKVGPCRNHRPPSLCFPRQNLLKCLPGNVGSKTVTAGSSLPASRRNAVRRPFDLKRPATHVQCRRDSFAPARSGVQREAPGAGQQGKTGDQCRTEFLRLSIPWCARVTHVPQEEDGTALAGPRLACGDKAASGAPLLDKWGC